ncbi:zinc finger protein AEBP2 [Podospora fimiseda]|uniref:Zinc finger protein AEBP2 n=1 Tax=Podospora fimiseda TaxID=252190 RepID=A0AAN7BTR7_9PEZI|nr:zinc finger protein AEBP2 [Podospora fimiseda]
MEYQSSYDCYSQHSPGGFDGLTYTDDSSNNWIAPAMMKRSNSAQSEITTYTVDSSDTTGTHSSGYSTSLPFDDSPTMENLVVDGAPASWYQYPEPQDASQLVAAAGSQYYQHQDYYNTGDTSTDTQKSPTEDIQFTFASQTFDALIQNIEDTAKQATDSAMTLIRNGQMPSYGDYSVITTEIVDASIQWHRGQDQNASYREAVQRLLTDYLYRQFSDVTPAYADVARVLEEAAYQLLARLQGQKVYEICYFAISAALAHVKQQIDDDSAAASTATTTPSTPVVPSSSTSSSSRQSYPCRIPGCKQKGFSRSADLDRHHNMVHLDETKKKKFVCDYKRCGRHEIPFFRQDHFRDHLRDFHKEDLPKRSKKEDVSWWSGRSKSATANGWWRCNKCLITRVSVRGNGFVCPTCGASCELERQKLRGRI